MEIPCPLYCSGPELQLLLPPPLVGLCALHEGAEGGGGDVVHGPGRLRQPQHLHQPVARGSHPTRDNTQSSLAVRHIYLNFPLKYISLSRQIFSHFPAKILFTFPPKFFSLSRQIFLTFPPKCFSLSRQNFFHFSAGFVFIFPS